MKKGSEAFIRLFYEPGEVVEFDWGEAVLFTSVPKLLVQIKEARSAKTLGILQGKFEKYDLVICDEFGYVSCDKENGGN